MNYHYDPRLILPPQMPAFPPYVWFGNVLSPPECDALSQLAETRGLTPGEIGNGGALDQVAVDVTYRKADTAQLVPSDRVSGETIDWLFERVRDKVMWANANYYRFDLHGLWQQINYLKYLAPENPGDVPGHYDAHQDFGGGDSSQRKLSVVIQLSNPRDYDGCRLLLHTEKEFDPGHVEQGDMIVFPSWCVHRVTNITRGERRALVSWVSGPQFR
jgi:PKHD-type hydroxylase